MIGLIKIVQKTSLAQGFIDYARNTYLQDFGEKISQFTILLPSHLNVAVTALESQLRRQLMHKLISNKMHKKMRTDLHKSAKSKVFWWRVMLCSLIAALVFFIKEMPFATIGCLLVNFIFLGLHQQAATRILNIRLLKSKIYNSILMDRQNG